MRVGLLTTSFPRTHDDIAGNFVLGFARTLTARGHEVEVLAPEPSTGGKSPTFVNEPRLQVRHVAYLRPRALERTFYGAGVPDNLRRDPLAWLGLVPFPLALARATQARAARWDAIVSHWALPCALVAGAFASERRPHLAVFHSADVHALLQLPFRGALARRIARSAHRLWFVTPEHREAFVSLLPRTERADATRRSIVSPMGIDDVIATPIDREPTRSALGLPRERFCVLALARLVPIKGIDVAIRAIAGREATLLVAGDGSERERLENLARELGADARFLGMVGPERKRELFAAADAFVMPSRPLASGRSEGVPTAMLEAMLHGLPVIASASGGIASALEHEATGLLVAPDDPASLGRALDRLQRDHALRERLAASARLRAKHRTWAAIGPLVEAALEPTRPVPTA